MAKRKRTREYASSGSESRAHYNRVAQESANMGDPGRRSTVRRNSPAMEATRRAEGADADARFFKSERAFSAAEEAHRSAAQAHRTAGNHGEAARHEQSATNYGKQKRDNHGRFA